ncbi:MAG: hypothetical protein ACW98F_10755, partial [Candidatus Hodarchaeales archaeon]
MDSIVRVFLEQLESESEEYHHLGPFFKSVFTYFYVFPISEQVTFTDRMYFVSALSNPTDFPRMKLMFQLFELKELSTSIMYLNKTEWWWEGLNDIISKGIDIYQLSYLYESLSQLKMRKATGTFFTPKNQVKFITRFSLHRYITLNNSLALEESILYRLIFQGIVSKEKRDDYKKLVNQMSSILIIDPSCGTGLFLHEMLEIFTVIFSKIMIPNSILKNEKIFLNLY